jgi:DNA-binding GntR family transcriptional regulator
MSTNSGQTFSEVEKVSLRERIAQIIQGRILAGDFAPGDRIAEIAVSRQMGVSQNTVREALQIIEHQGLVTKIANVGTFVTRLSHEEVAQIYRVRMELEPLAAELAAERVDEAGGRLLDELAARMVSSARMRDNSQSTRADLVLHRSIWQMSGNRFLENALLEMSNPLFAYLMIKEGRAGPPNIAAVTERHCELVRMIKTKDVAKARETSRRLIEESLQDAVRVI